MTTITSSADLWRILQENPVDPEWAEDLKRMREEDRANSVDIWAS
jgi:hypothetical protein